MQYFVWQRSDFLEFPQVKIIFKTLQTLALPIFIHINDKGSNVLLSKG
jgi:hypothetical protein